MLNLLANLIATPSAKVRTLANQVAEASLSDAIRLISTELAGMSLAEARGYVRARCGRLVRRQTRIAIKALPTADASWSPAVVSIATERLIPLVLREAKVGVPRAAANRAAA